MNIHQLIALIGALVGFVAAAGVDYHAFASAPAGSAFDIPLALKRWAAGAMGGIALASTIAAGIGIPAS